VSTDWTRIWYRQLSIAGVFAYGNAPYGDRQRDIYDISIQLMRNDGFGELNMVTHVFPLEEYRAALRAALDKSGHRSVKVVFQPRD
jgi:threonine dehydrogenase-like Zn-dependent dehydrogenase